MPPKASTSAASKKPTGAANGGPAKKTAAAGGSKSSGSKLTPKERQLYDFAMRSENKIITQDMVSAEFEWKVQEFIGELTSLTKKRLLELRTGANNEVFWVGISVASAQAAAGNSDEANLLLNLIEQSGNLGIWSRTLKAKSGLHQTVIDKCLKNLETTRAIKSVKSIKHPTRKIYLLQHIQPSTELTGGPWYNGADLDVEFISNILKLCKRLVHQASSSGGSAEQLFPTAHTPYLPTAYDVLQGIKETGATHVPLAQEHIESLLEVLRMDGEVERIKVMREPGDYDSEDEEAEEQAEAAVRGKKRKAPGATGGRGKRPRTEAGDEDGSDALDLNLGEEEEENEEEAEVDEDGLPPPVELNGHGLSKKRKRAGPPGRSKFYWVYRSVSSASDHLNLYIGLIDAPCGVCPVAASCDNRGRPSIQDESLSQTGLAVPTPGASKLSKQQKEKQLVAFKPPGSLGAVDLAGPWSGGASRGVQRPGAINPSTCKYYRDWLEG